MSCLRSKCLIRFYIVSGCVLLNALHSQERHGRVASCEFYQLVATCQQVATSLSMDQLPYRQKFLNDRNSKICYHSLKDHPKVSKMAKFRCEML